MLGHAARGRRFTLILVSALLVALVLPAFAVAASPKVTLVADRAANVFRGQSPAGHMDLWYRAGLMADSDDHLEWDTPGGHYSMPLEEDDDLIGGIDAHLTWTGPHGNSITVDTFSPYIVVNLGSADFSGKAPTGKLVRATIRDGVANTLLGEDTAQPSDDWNFAGTFRDADGHRVIVNPGMRLRALGMASDANWIVPNMSASANVASDHVIGWIEPTGLAIGGTIEVWRTGHQRGWAHIAIQPDGTFDMDFSDRPDLGFDPANIKRGDRIVVSALLDTGDGVAFTFKVP